MFGSMLAPQCSIDSCPPLAPGAVGAPDLIAQPRSGPLHSQLNPPSSDCCCAQRTQCVKQVAARGLESQFGGGSAKGLQHVQGGQGSRGRRHGAAHSGENQSAIARGASISRGGSPTSGDGPPEERAATHGPQRAAARSVRCRRWLAAAGWPSLVGLFWFQHLRQRDLVGILVILKHRGVLFNDVLDLGRRRRPLHLGA